MVCSVLSKSRTVCILFAVLFPKGVMLCKQMVPLPRPEITKPAETEVIIRAEKKNCGVLN